MMGDRNMKSKRVILGILAGLVTQLAVVASSAACFIHAYQPKTPKSLQK